MKIGGFQKFSLIDYPGKISCIIFFSGCNFRCPFCYSSELVVPEKIAEQPSIDKDEILDYLEERKDMLEGVVFCGGEPTLNSDLIDFGRQIKEMGYYVKLDTNGSNPEMIKSLLDQGIIDYVAMDIKSPIRKEDYKRATGGFGDIEKIRESIRIIKESAIDYEFRSTIVPGIHTLEDVVEMAKSIAPARKYYLQQFVGNKETIDKELTKRKPFMFEDVARIVKVIGPMFGECNIR